MATSFRALMSSGVFSPGCGSYHLHFIKARCETSLISRQTWSFHDARLGLGGRGAVDVSPIRSCQELSEDRIQTLGQERPGQPAVTSLTHGWDHPSGSERPTLGGKPDPGLHAHQGRRVHTQADMFYVHIEQTCMHIQWHTGPLPMRVRRGTRTMLRARAILGNHQYNLWRCPDESFPHRQIRQTEVTLPSSWAD